MTELRRFLAPTGSLPERDDIVESALETVRRHLGMDVAFLSEFVDDTIVFRAIRAPGLGDMVKVGDTLPQEQVYCGRIRDGLLPRLIQDTRDYPLARQIGLTETLPIRSHVSVPITGHDGTVFGMFCCLGHEPAPGLNQRDLAVMELFADLSAGQVNAALRARSSRDAAQMRIDRAIAGAFHMVFQPIRDLQSGRTLGYEALSRFDSVPYRSPDQWFAEAASIDRATELELHVIEAALSSLPDTPPDRYLSINASPQAVASGALAPVLRSVDVRRVVLEMTEHARVDDYDEIMSILAPLRAEGLRVAVDDAGAGYAGLQQILRLRPDLIKLDMSLTRDIDHDDARRSLAAALITFGARTGATLIAEGIETVEEQEALLQIGVQFGQGYLLGRPLPCASAFSDARPVERMAQGA